MRPPALISALACLALVGCGDVPELIDATSARARASDYPELVNIDPLLAGIPAHTPTATGADPLAARVAALRARGARLRRTVIESDRRRSMETALRTEG